MTTQDHGTVYRSTEWEPNMSPGKWLAKGRFELNDLSIRTCYPKTPHGDRAALGDDVLDGRAEVREGLQVATDGVLNRVDPEYLLAEWGVLDA